MAENFWQTNTSIDFERKNFYGWDFSWFAVDSDNCIAQFTTGFGTMPKKLFESKQDYDRVSTYFENAPNYCSSLLSKAAHALQSKGIGDYSIALEEARKGIFIYDEENYGTIHRLYALPKHSIKLESLGYFVQEYLENFRIKDLKFSETEEIDVGKKFICE